MMEHPDFKGRAGTFCIDGELIDDHPAEVMLLLGRCVVVRAEALWHRRQIEYTAYCQDFDVVPDGWELPRYVGIFTRSEVEAEDGTLTPVVTFDGWRRG